MLEGGHCDAVVGQFIIECGHLNMGYACAIFHLFTCNSQVIHISHGHIHSYMGKTGCNAVLYWLSAVHKYRISNGCMKVGNCVNLCH